MSDLTVKPCPFCGCEMPDADKLGDCYFDQNQGFKWGFFVCSGCAATGPEVRTQYAPIAHWKDEAIEAWNERKP